MIAFLLAAAQAVAPPPVANGAPLRLTRAEAVARALAAHPEVRKSRAAQGALRGLKDEALADALPELNLLGSGSRFRDPSLLNSSSFDSFPPELRGALRPIPANLFDGAFEVRQTLWSFKLGAALRAARHGLLLGAEDVRRTEHDVALLVLRAYNDYVLAREKVVVSRKALRQKEVHAEMARTRRAAGVATELEELRTAVDVANAQAQLERARGEADLARAALNAAMVLPVHTELEPVDGLERQPVPSEAVADALAQALAQRAEVKAADLNVRVQEELVRVARAESRPRLDLRAGWGYSVREPGNFLESDYTRWNAAVTLTVPVFDGFRTRGRVAQAQAERLRAEQDLVAVRNRVSLEVQQAVDRLRTTERVLDAADLNVGQAARALEMTQANYRHGAATTLDVLDAQAALTLAESLRLQALYDHADTRAVLRYVVGRPPLDIAAAGAAQDTPKAGAQ